MSLISQDLQLCVSTKWSFWLGIFTVSTRLTHSGCCQHTTTAIYCPSAVYYSLWSHSTNLCEKQTEMQVTFIHWKTLHSWFYLYFFFFSPLKDSMVCVQSTKGSLHYVMFGSLAVKKQTCFACALAVQMIMILWSTSHKIFTTRLPEVK